MIRIPSTVTNVGDFAFSGAESLRLITVDEDNPSYTSEKGMLYSKDKSNLICCPPGFSEKLMIPSCVTNVNNYGLDCPFVTSFSVDSHNPVYCSVEGVLYSKDKTTVVRCPTGKFGKLTISPGVTTIKDAAFHNCKFTSVSIPTSMTTIGNYTFHNCKKLTSVQIPSSVTEICTGAFMSCESLTSVVIPQGVTKIGKCAFVGCESLTSVVIPPSVTTIEKFAFEYSSKLSIEFHRLCHSQNYLYTKHEEEYRKLYRANPPHAIRGLHAQRKLESLFGIKFGEKKNKDAKWLKIGTVHGRMDYRFYPLKGFLSFSDYDFALDYNDEVFWIRARYQTYDRDEAIRLSLSIINELQVKYGIKFDYDRESQMWGMCFQNGIVIQMNLFEPNETGGKYVFDLRGVDVPVFKAIKEVEMLGQHDADAL